MTRVRGICPRRSEEGSALPGLLLAPATRGTRAHAFTDAPWATPYGPFRAIPSGGGRCSSRRAQSTLHN
jgi:hypothetical protein